MAKTFIVLLSVLLSACVDDGIRIVGDSEPSSDALVDHDAEPVRDPDAAESDPAADEPISDYSDGDIPEDVSGDDADLVPDAHVDCFVGSACTSDDQCGCLPSGEGQCLTEFAGIVQLPGGYCTAACISNDECDYRSRCTEIVTGMRYCIRLCSTSAECRMEEGYTCSIVMDWPYSYCLPV